MIPANAFTPLPVVSAFLPPYDLAYTPLTQVVRGGIAIGNNQGGRDTQNWIVEYTNNAITVKPVNGAIEFSLPVTGVLAVSLAFDNAMRVVLTWTDKTGSYLYYYDTLTLSYITVQFINTTSSRVVVDCAQGYYNASSDVIFAYVLNNNLYYRQQRDRYGVEYLIGDTGVSNYLLKMGPTYGNRLQFELTQSITNTVIENTVDPNNSLVELHITGEGADNSVTIVDTSLNTLVVSNSGGVVNSTLNSKSGTGSIKITPGQYISIPSNLTFANGDFTIEMWVYPIAFQTDAAAYLFAMDDAFSSNQIMQLAYHSNGTLYFIGFADGARGSAWSMASQVNTVVANKWQHVAVVKNANTVTLYFDGVTIGTHTGTMYVRDFTYATIGACYYANTNAYIDDFKITKLAKYNSDFTPTSTLYGLKSFTVYEPTENYTTVKTANAPIAITGFSYSFYKPTVTVANISINGATPLIIKDLEISILVNNTIDSLYTLDPTPIGINTLGNNSLYTNTFITANINNDTNINELYNLAPTPSSFTYNDLINRLYSNSVLNFGIEVYKLITVLDAPTINYLNTSVLIYGTVFDSSYVNSNITVTGTVTESTTVIKYFPKSLYFNGSSGLILTDKIVYQTESPLSLSNTTFTIETWINVTSVTSGQYQTIVSEYGVIGLFLKYKSENVAQLCWYNNGDKILFGDIPINEWHHVAAVGSLGNVSLYVDGVKSTITTPHTAFNVKHIGAHPTEGFNGYMSDIAVILHMSLYSTAYIPPTIPLMDRLTGVL